MKKIALALLIVFSISSVAFGITRAGRFGLEGSYFLITSPLWLNQYRASGAIGCGGLFYNFTEDLSMSLGAIYAADPRDIMTQATDSAIGIILKGLWNLGRGDTVPHLGIEAWYLNRDLPSIYSSVSVFNLALLYGVEAMLLPDFSVMLDARLIDYQTMNPKGNIMDHGSQLILISGATLSFRWYIL